MLLLKMASEGGMLRELSVAVRDRAVEIVPGFDVGHGVLLHLVLSEELLEAVPALVRLHATVSHSVTMHVGFLRKLHLANVTLIHRSLMTFMSFLKHNDYTYNVRKTVLMNTGLLINPT